MTHFKHIAALLLALLFAQATFTQEPSKQITIEDIWESGKFSPRGISGLVSMKDGIHYTVRQRDSINQYRYDDGKLVQTILHKGMLVPDGATSPIQFNSYNFSNDESKMLLSTETESIYRHSSVSNFYIFDRTNQKLTLLSSNEKQRLADFSPDGNMVAFVRDNNLFISNLIDGSEKQITHDGLQNQVINGTTDWVYEEEFAITKGFYWSPDGKNIAFMRFDESNVKEFRMVNYGNLYPDYYEFKYPKAGEDNSVVSIHIYNISSGKTIRVETGDETDIYLPRLQWTQDASKLSVQRLNRHQNNLEILLADAATGKTSLIYSEKNKYYIDITNDLTFLNDNKHFLITSEMSGYNHIYLYSLNGSLLRPVTSGSWEVTNFYGVDPKNERVYYQAAKNSPVDREIYSIALSGKGERILAGAPGTNIASFSKSFEYFIGTHQTANQPPAISLFTGQGKRIRELETNDKLKETVQEYNFSMVEFFNFTTSENVTLNAWMIKPPDFDPTQKHPVLIYVYGGPGSQTVQNTWGRAQSAWFQMLAQMGYIIVSVDNRGTGARGEEFKKMTYLQLGKFEILDYIESAKYLGSLPYADSKRIGIFGWSYGGYMALLCMTKGSDYFSTGIAVAPVASWKHYDNIYTERFMRTPQENPEGYNDNSPINFADSYKGKLLIVHGTADDNVHVENSVDMIDALIKSKKQFEMLLYPNRDHGIYGGNTRSHLFQKMTDFLEKNL